MSDQAIDVLVFSDNIDTREAVIEGVGIRPAKGMPPIHWVETATRFGVLEAMKEHDFAALILDGETTKEGGMAVAREIDNAFETVPPILMLTGRPQDDWLAEWSGASAVVPAPWDALHLQETLARLLQEDARA